MLHAFAALPLLVATPAFTQTDAEAIAQVLGHEGFVQTSLALPNGAPDAWSVALPLGGRVERVELVRHSLRDADFQLLVDDGSGAPRAVEPPPPATYRGWIPGWPEARVALSLTPAGARGIVLDAGGVWSIAPAADFLGAAAAPGAHVVARELRSPFEDGACGTPDPWRLPAAGAGVQRSNFDGSATCLTVADIAFDCDYECYLQFGSSDVATLQDVEAVLAAVDLVYQSEVYITYNVTTILVRTAEPDPYDETDSGLLLTEFQTEWNGPLLGTPRDMVHLATGKELDSNIIGLAFIGGVCHNGVEYGLTQWNLSFGGRVAVLQHELGHNWNAPHCLDPNFCGIMCGGCVSKFGPITRQVILDYRDTRGCLVFPPPKVTGLFPTSTFAPLTPGTGETVAVLGDCFTDESVVVVDGVPLDTLPETFSIQNPNFASFEMPLVSTLGAVEIRVDDPRGSASTTAQFVVPSSPIHQVGNGDLVANGNTQFTSEDVPFVLAGNPGAVHLLVFSTSNVPSVHPLVTLGLGNAFTQLGIGGAYTIGAPGWTSFDVPVDGVLFTTFYSQTIDLSAGAPFKTSNVQEIFILF